MPHATISTSPRVPKRKAPNIAISGTPGVGKSSLARSFLRLAEQDPSNLEYTVLDLGQEAAIRGCRDRYDHERNAWVIDESELVDDLMTHELDQDVEGGKIFDWIHADMWALPDEDDIRLRRSRCPVDLVITLRANNSVLFDRYQKRNRDDLEHLYSEKKIEDNIDAEIMDEIGQENDEAFQDLMSGEGAEEQGVIVVQLPSDSDEDVEQNVTNIFTWALAWWTRRQSMLRASGEDDVRLAPRWTHLPFP